MTTEVREMKTGKEDKIDKTAINQGKDKETKIPLKRWEKAKTSTSAESTTRLQKKNFKKK